jgi:hypothetical protein
MQGVQGGAGWCRGGGGIRGVGGAWGGGGCRGCREVHNFPAA